jgi:hypothetical protein
MATTKPNGVFPRRRRAGGFAHSSEIRIDMGHFWKSPGLGDPRSDQSRCHPRARSQVYAFRQAAPCAFRKSAKKPTGCRRADPAAAADDNYSSDGEPPPSGSTDESSPQSWASGSEALTSSYSGMSMTMAEAPCRSPDPYEPKVR